MINAKEKLSIEKRNEKIVNAIYVSRMCGSNGFKIFNKFVESLRVKSTNPDINELVNDKVDTLRETYKRKGRSDIIFEIIYWLDNQVKIAEQPMKDPKTGEFEKLKHKKAKN